MHVHVFRRVHAYVYACMSKESRREREREREREEGKESGCAIVITCMTKTPVVKKVTKDATKVKEGERVKVGAYRSVGDVDDSSWTSLWR